MLRPPKIKDCALLFCSLPEDYSPAISNFGFQTISCLLTTLPSVSACTHRNDAIKQYVRVCRGPLSTVDRNMLALRGAKAAQLN